MLTREQLLKAMKLREGIEDAAGQQALAEVRSIVFRAFYSTYVEPFGIGAINTALDAVADAVIAALAANPAPKEGG